MQLIQIWVWSGINRSSQLDFSHIRITNIVSLLFLFTLLAQLPLNIYYWHQGGCVQVQLLLIHCGALWLIPLLNHYHQWLYAKLLLCCIYLLYIVCSTIYLGQASQCHFLLLLALPIVPFIFVHQVKLLWGWMILFSSLFLYLENKPAVLSAIASDYLNMVIHSNQLSLVLVFTSCAYYIQRNMLASNKSISREKQRAERLLINILPVDIAKRLKHTDKPVADYFQQASILFADIQGFSHLAHSRTPQELVFLLNDIFSRFDTVLHKYGLEKIKTIGDAYMAVAGVPNSDPRHARHCCDCALEMLDTFKQFCHLHQLDNGIRIGINSGDLIAGVIGKNKFSYDLWGENVNLASRMESHGLCNMIQVSEKTYQLVKEEFIFQPRASLTVKGMGQYQTYWLKQKVPHAA